MDFIDRNSHLDSLQIRLTNERERLANAKSDKEREIRSVWVAGIEKEIADTLGEVANMSDDEILAFLTEQEN